MQTKKGCRDLRTIKLADHIADLIVWGWWQAFCVCTCTVHDDKCTVFVEGLEWVIFVWYTGFAWQNSLPNWNWHWKVTRLKLLGEALFFKLMLNSHTGFSLNIIFFKMIYFCKVQGKNGKAYNHLILFVHQSPYDKVR